MIRYAFLATARLQVEFGVPQDIEGILDRPFDVEDEILSIH